VHSQPNEPIIGDTGAPPLKDKALEKAQLSEIAEEDVIAMAVSDRKAQKMQTSQIKKPEFK